MAECTCPCEAGVIARRSCDGSAVPSDFSLRRQDGKRRRTAVYGIAHLYEHLGAGGQNHVATRSELDEYNALAARHTVSDLARENDAAGQQPGNLFENDTVTVFGFQRANVLLVEFGRSRIHSVQILAAVILDSRNQSGGGRTVHVHIED